jgi:carboxymethylenebutenolidase
MKFLQKQLTCLGAGLYVILFLLVMQGLWLEPAHSADGVPADANKFYGKMITLGDFGAEDLAYLSLPQKAPLGGIVVIHDRWGLDDNTKHLVDTLAEKGYIVLAVDLYNGRASNDVNQANVLLANLRLESTMKTIQAGVRLLKESPRLKVYRAAVVGYSSGATIALLAAQQIPNVDAVGAINPVIAPRDKKISKYRVPISLVFPRQREGDVIAGLDGFQKLMDDMKNPLEVHYIQPASDGFADPRSAHYNAANAGEAWDTLNDFLTRELSKPPKPPTIIEKVEDFFK